MDTAAFSKLLLLQAGDHLLDSDALLEPGCPTLDPGYYSACSSLSPASSIDSCCFSPPCFQWGAVQEKEATNPSSCISQADKRQGKEELPAQEKRRSRSKFPGKKRESASEREKLRMRDLTKALHHLRTYLPTSVAPPEQTLTKIETLRLTISYISHLSAQLGLSEDTPCLKRKMDFTPCQYSQDMPQCPQGRSMSGQWCQEILQGNIQSSNQYCLPLATSYTNNTEPHMETDSLMPDVSYQDMSLYHNQVFK
ncbi:mesoderm posterior protein 2-like [Oncorhynchus tshawytscha]|uniref:mesoderm posterior protein 2-like n=1 Tax=Oncorhynchus tshawytscha TaxID=74940 RepID=UPI001C3C60CB|nr:mesoderm posterior protein 2-like [Oncorhynchus tshawytscha]